MSPTAYEYIESGVELESVDSRRSFPAAIAKDQREEEVQSEATGHLTCWYDPRPAIPILSINPSKFLIPCCLDCLDLGDCGFRIGIPLDS
jgi:hypothetical protein